MLVVNIWYLLILIGVKCWCFEIWQLFLLIGLRTFGPWIFIVIFLQHRALPDLWPCVKSLFLHRASPYALVMRGFQRLTPYLSLKVLMTTIFVTSNSTLQTLYSTLHTSSSTYSYGTVLQPHTGLWWFVPGNNIWQLPSWARRYFYHLGQLS